MKYSNRDAFLFVVFFIFTPLQSWAHEASGTARIGPNMAVLAAEESDGIQLSEAAMKTIQIKTVALSELKGGVLPESSILHYRDGEAIYRVRGNWFKRIDLDKNGPKRRTLSGFDLKPADRIVIQGVPLLRASELEAFGSEEEEEEGHGEQEDHNGEKHEH